MGQTSWPVCGLCVDGFLVRKDILSDLYLKDSGKMRVTMGGY